LREKQWIPNIPKDKRLPNIKELYAYAHIVRKFASKLSELPWEELGEKVRLKVRDGEFALTIEECLLHHSQNSYTI